MEGNMDPKDGDKMSDDRIQCLALVSALLTLTNFHKARWIFLAIYSSRSLS
jgi:hypothetical protein